MTLTSEIEQSKPTKDRSIPDLWEIAHLEDLTHYSLGGRKAGDLVLDCWHMAHTLQDQASALYEACKAADSWLLPYPEDPNNPHTNSLRALMDQIRAAIAKAESK